MLTLWEPKTLTDFHRRLDELWTNQERGSAFSAPVDIEEKEDHYLLTADLPGIEEKDIKVSVSEGVLTLSGSRYEESETKDDKGKKGRARWHRERTYGQFSRSFTLGPNVDPKHIAAKYRKGVLYLTLPKAEESKPQEIVVKSS